MPNIAETLFQLLLILMAARVCAEVAARARVPSVLGELAAGVVLGPSLLGLIHVDAPIQLLAEIGIILLLFEVGLETDATLLWRAGPKSAVVALAGLALPFALGYVAARYLFDLPQLAALFVGGTLTATSIGITVRVLRDLGLDRSHEGRVVLGAAVLDDVFGVVLLALLYEFAVGGGVSLGKAGRVLLFMGLFFALAPVVAKAMSVVIKRFDARSEIPGLIPTTVISLVLLFAVLAHRMGAPELLGGFAAGLALSRRFFVPLGAALASDPAFSERIAGQMGPVIHLFTPIFFVTVGLSIDLGAVDWGSGFIWAFALVLFGVATAGKMAAPWLISETPQSRVVIGLAMVPRGEVGLVFAELGLASGILDNALYTGMVMIIALTTLGPPFLLKGYVARNAARLAPPEASSRPPAAPPRGQGGAP
ncbi:MAG: cation:proton antiporter [Nitrospirae bacterium]|nr:cation:proton antiporter [Nitrospirota bacterium]